MAGSEGGVGREQRDIWPASVEAVEGIHQPEDPDSADRGRVFAHRQGQPRKNRISGQVSSDTSGKIIGEGDFEAQVEQVFANLKIAVEAA